MTSFIILLSEFEFAWISFSAGAAEEWDDNDCGAERNTNAAPKDDEVDLEEEDGLQRRRKPLRGTPTELVMVTCPAGIELQPEKKKSNRCNHCSCSGTAFRSRESDYDLCEPCHRNLQRRVQVRFQEGDRMTIKGAGYNRKEGVDWRFCFYAGSDCVFSFAPCTQRKCILRLSLGGSKIGFVRFKFAVANEIHHARQSCKIRIES